MNNYWLFAYLDKSGNFYEIYKAWMQIELNFLWSERRLWAPLTLLWFRALDIKEVGIG